MSTTKIVLISKKLLIWEQYYIIANYINHRVRIVKIGKRGRGMTKEEVIEAFEMRVNGATYREIGEKFNCSKQYIEQVLKYSIKEKSIRFI